MYSRKRNLEKFLILTLLMLIVAGCTAGGMTYTVESPAGFWAGLWHGIISIITLIVHIFDSSIRVYEVNNTGGWYDFGFLLGAIGIWGGGSKVTYQSKKDKEKNTEWDEIGEKVERKIMRNLKNWADDVDQTEIDEDWDEITKKAERKLKQKIREWAEKE